MKRGGTVEYYLCHHLSVSSNGSTWVKHDLAIFVTLHDGFTFSILERIDVGETWLERGAELLPCQPFSILERIDVGETLPAGPQYFGSPAFQYPRTDRRG